MKTIANAFITAKAGHLAFATVCVLLLSTGVYTKVMVDRFGNQQDEFCKRFDRPSQFYLWCESHRQNTNVIATPRLDKVSTKPASSVVESQALP